MPSPDAIIDRLVLIYQQAARDIAKAVRDRGPFAKPSVREGFLMNQIDSILATLLERSDDAIDDLVVTAYTNSSRAAADANDVDDRNFGLIDQRAVEALAVRSKDDIRKGLQLARGKVDRFVRDTQLNPVANDAVRNKVAAAIATGQSPEDLARSLRPAIAGFVGAEQTDNLINILGDMRIQVGKRSFRIDHYARIVANTMRREAETQAAKNRMTENGLDLVEITTTKGVDDSCRVFEGLIASISGETEGFPQLSQLPNGGPPFHANCTHVIASRSAIFLSDTEKRTKGKIRKRFLGRRYADLEKIRRKEFNGSADLMRIAARS